jgi:hypothetical protein
VRKLKYVYSNMLLLFRCLFKTLKKFSFQYEEYSKKIVIVNKPKPLPRCHHVSQDKIVQVLAQVKGEVVRRRLRLVEFMKQYDKHCHQCILKENFSRALWTLLPNISAADVDLICEVLVMYIVYIFGISIFCSFKQFQIPVTPWIHRFQKIL